MLALTLSSHHDLKPEFPPPSLTYAREPPATPSPPSYPPVLWHPKNNSHANRLNAQKSTGPSSAEGKARSSMNALKTGIDAKTQLIRGETWTALQELIDEYYHRFHPTAPDQRLLVDTLIDCDWLLRRFRAIETQI